MLDAETRSNRDGHAHVPGAPHILVRVDPVSTGGYAAIVELHGEHDLGTAEAVRVALAPLFGGLLVDLTNCTFIDSTIVTILVRKAQALAQDGHRLELDAPRAGSPVARTLELISLDAILPTRQLAARAPRAHHQLETDGARGA
jgi:anti-anti-sigma factor